MVVASRDPKHPDNRPFWIPDTVRFDALPEAVRAAIIEIVNPAYQELVLEATGALEKAAGLSFVHTLWLEIVEQYEIGKGMAHMLPRGESSVTHRDAIGRHLRLLGAKEKFGKFLLQIQAVREKCDRGFGPSGAGLR
jgi:hypothetical protein